MKKLPTPPTEENAQDITPLQEKMFEELDALLSETPEANQASKSTKTNQASESNEITTSSPEKPVHKTKMHKKTKVKKTPFPASSTAKTKQLRSDFEAGLDDAPASESIFTLDKIYEEEAINPPSLSKFTKREILIDDKNRYEGHRQRVRALFDATRFKGWPQHHILEMLLFYTLERIDTKELARTLLDHFHTIQGVCDAPTESLLRIDGVGMETARFLKMIPAIASVYADDCETIDVKITTSEQAKRFLLPYFVDATYEKTVILCTDFNQRYAGISVVGEGGKSSTPFDIRRILETVYAKQAYYIFLAHNHTNSSITPSVADWETTKEAVILFNSLDLRIVDHLVFSKSKYVSMYELSKLQNRSIPW